MTSLITFIVLLCSGVIFGSLNERKHFTRLRKAEAELSHVKVLNIKHPIHPLEEGGVLVTGNVVIAIDYFKKITATLRMIFGGRLNSYESLMERARREAIVRMQRKAVELGADTIYNARVEFSTVGQQPRISGAELLAYGTAVKER